MLPSLVRKVLDQKSDFQDNLLEFLKVRFSKAQ
jgi:hypothetical protein